MAVNEETSREALKAQKKQEKEEHKEAANNKKIRVRLIPIWLRLIIIIVLSCLSLIIGAIFGYSVLGDGKAGDVFKKSTWTYIIDLIEKE